ncbi:MAG: hypothetical protein AB8I08_23890 [Sandaracinaceae bacterium]
MGLLSDVALGGVTRLERTLGKRAALSTATQLVDTLPDGAGRDEAWLRAIGLASELGDPSLDLLLARWATAKSRRKSTSKHARRLLARLLSTGLSDAARQLAEAEQTRTQGRRSEASAAYAHGRALEQLGQDDAALSAYRKAMRRGAKQPRLRRSAAARETRLLQRIGRVDEAARQAKELLPLSDAAPVERLWVAAAALHAPGRYTRAAALDVLVELSAVEALRPHVERLAAQHAERFGPLTAPEADRVRMVLAGNDEATRALEALLSLSRREAVAPSSAASTSPRIAAMLPRARAVADGDAPGPQPTNPEALHAWLGLAIVHAASGGRGVEARSLLDTLAARIEAGARIEGVHWSAFRAAAADSPVRARRLAAACLSRPGEPPSEGYVTIAQTLTSLTAFDEVAVALARAVRRRERGAKAQLAKHLRHLGWRAAEAGERDHAIAHLREAKRLAED